MDRGGPDSKIFRSFDAGDTWEDDNFSQRTDDTTKTPESNTNPQTQDNT